MLLKQVNKKANDEILKEIKLKIQPYKNRNYKNIKNDELFNRCYEYIKSTKPSKR